MLSGLKAYFGANAGLTAQISTRLHRVTAPANSGSVNSSKYVTYKRLDDNVRLRAGGSHSSARTNRVGFTCHGATLEDALAVYDALRAVIGETQYRGTWGTSPAYTIQSAYWLDDSYAEDFNEQTREYEIDISLAVTWNS